MKCETSEGAERELLNGGEAAMYSKDQQVSVNLTGVFLTHFFSSFFSGSQSDLMFLSPIFFSSFPQPVPQRASNCLQDSGEAEMPDGTTSEVSAKVSEGGEIILNKVIAPRCSNVVDTSI